MLALFGVLYLFVHKRSAGSGGGKVPDSSEMQSHSQSSHYDASRGASIAGTASIRGGHTVSTRGASVETPESVTVSLGTIVAPVKIVMCCEHAVAVLHTIAYMQTSSPPTLELVSLSHLFLV